MKITKGYLTLCLMLSCTVCSMAQQGRVKGAHPYKLSENKQVASKYSHWSLTPHFGINMFDGDFNSEMKSAMGFPGGGGDIEYSFNPVWNLGVTYMFDRYHVTGDPSKGNNADLLLDGYLHKAGAYVSMDFVNLFFPAAKRRIFSAEGIVGGGYSWYKRLLYYPDEARYHSSLLPASGPDDKYHSEMYVQAGLNMEFNLCRTIALGVRGTYSYFVNDYIDGRGYEGMVAIPSKNNDGIVDVTLNMRFKLVAVSRTHMRNISQLTYEKKKFGLEDKDDKNKKGGGRDTVIIRHDSIIVREVINNSATDNNSSSEMTALERLREAGQYYYVYFDNGRADLVDNALATIQQVADRMEDDKDLYAVVVGYCDNTGSNSLNYTLGDSRADRVTDELLMEYGIPANRIYSTGLGKLVGKRSTASYSPNRRASIRLVDKATFDRMGRDLDDRKEHRMSEETGSRYTPTVSETSVIAESKSKNTEWDNPNTIPLSETGRPEKVNPYINRNSIFVEVEASTTLSKLARQYYNNTHCWIYIYIANMEQLPNPNALEPGMDLRIPELTAEELRTSKDECLRKYYEARNNR